jgi:tetratricopeptide (TPR) repeat protein
MAWWNTLDPEAIALARRLEGLPLALATAGTYLRQRSDSFGDYPQLYTDKWNDLNQNSNRLWDYEGRTLYSTWNLCLTQIQVQDPAAVKLLRLMAYLDNQDLWYELFKAGADAKSSWWAKIVKNRARLSPSWWTKVMKSRARFSDAMSKLHDYSLVEARAESYSLHPCVHDWTLSWLNREFDEELWRLAVQCIARSVKWDTEAEYWVVNRRVLQHVYRLEHDQFRALIDWRRVDPGDLSCIAHLYSQSDINVAAEQMYVRALQGYEKAWGGEHTSTLDTVNNLGLLYAKQGKMEKAEQMYVRALQGKEKAWGGEHTSTLNTVNNLGSLYAKQGKMEKAEQMYVRALQGYKKCMGLDHPRTRIIARNLHELRAKVKADEQLVR